MVLYSISPRVVKLLGWYVHLLPPLPISMIDPFVDSGRCPHVMATPTSGTFSRPLNYNQSTRRTLQRRIIDSPTLRARGRHSP